MARIDASKLNLEERVVQINRVSKVVKGGRRFSFSSIVVVGDGAGHVGAGLGKAGEVPDSIRKGSDDAKKNLIRIPMVESRTIPHEITATFGASKVILRPASSGTGVIAGGGVRAVLEAAGIKDVLSKSLGNNNPVNAVRATLMALTQLKNLEEEEIKRGKPLASFGLGPSDQKIVAPKQSFSIYVPQVGSSSDRNDRGRGGRGGNRPGPGGAGAGGNRNDRRGGERRPGGKDSPLVRGVAVADRRGGTVNEMAQDRGTSTPRTEFSAQHQTGNFNSETATNVAEAPGNAGNQTTESGNGEIQAGGS